MRTVRGRELSPRWTGGQIAHEARCGTHRVHFTPDEPNQTSSTRRDLHIGTRVGKPAMVVPESMSEASFTTAQEFNGTCLTCGYSLRGLSDERCPECGRLFRASDPTTFRTFTDRWSWRRLARPPGKIHLWTVVISTPLMLYAASLPPGTGAGLGLLGCAFLVALIVIGMDYAIRCLSAVACRLLPVNDANRISRSSRRAWVATPICLLMLGSAVPFNWPMYFRFALSRNAFEAETKKLLAGVDIGEGHKGGDPYGKWVGLYYVDSVRVRSAERRVEFFTSDVFGFGYRVDDLAQYILEIPKGWYFCYCGWS